MKIIDLINGKVKYKNPTWDCYNIITENEICIASINFHGIHHFDDKTTFQSIESLGNFIADAINEKLEKERNGNNPTQPIRQ